MAPGIVKRHSRRCRSAAGGRCNCEPTYEAWVWSNRDGKKIREKFKRESEAKTWRADAMSAVSKGGLRAPKPTTIQQAWDEWLPGARAGTILNRSGDPYKPSAVRSYERAMRLRVLDPFGAARLADVRRPDLQEFVNGLIVSGLSASAIQVTILPLRALFKRAVARGEIAVNPCTGLDMPAVRSGLKRIASPREAERLIAALPAGDRPIWATAMYAGLRRGEMQALRVEDISIGLGVIYVERSWDVEEGAQETKNREKRRVPIPEVLQGYLSSLPKAGLAFGSGGVPFDPRGLVRRADKAWKGAKLLRITPHECRHTFASLMIAAGVNAKTLSTYMGHASIEITFDTYGHLMPGNEQEAAGLLDAYLKGATGASTGAHLADEARKPHNHAVEA